MTPVEKALWFIEMRLGQETSLSDIARISGVSPFHLSHAFGAATGQSVMRYRRARRLTEAARALAGGAADILAIALDAGYASHEAFTRAFRDQFAHTPEAVRARRHIDNIPMMEPIRMDKTLIVELEPPRFETGKMLLIAGLGERYRFETNEGIPTQWQRFIPHLGSILGQVGTTTYGVCHNGDDDGSFEYVTGVEVAGFADIAAGFSRVRIPERRYAVFSHRGHVSGIRATVYSIWNDWLPKSGHKVADAPNFERYGTEFDGRSGNGTVEIWVPLQTEQSWTNSR